MMIVTGEQSGLAAFHPRARLLKLIGAELISDDVVAITELVKNAHDADASSVSIQFIAVTGNSGEILIQDDGFGMDLDTLLTRWMQPAGSSKGRQDTRLTPAGRRVLGEKGVGRFAADKLASRLELVSRRDGEPTEVRAVFDWDQFDGDERMLADVQSHWQVRPAEWLEGKGTVLRLTGLRGVWNERQFRRLSTRLSRLISPLGADGGFRIVLESDEFPQYAGEVAGGFLDRAPYRIEASLEAGGIVCTRLNDGEPARQPWHGPVPLSCGPVRVKLFAFDLETESLARIGSRNDVRSWLREWTGVSVYRDGFRVWPYGEPHDDWLRLDQRRVNNPVIRLSNNQVVGFVEISADANPLLRDQTNREGLIHNEALADLQRFVLLAMQLLEADRQTSRHPTGPRRQKRQAGQEDRSEELGAVPATLEKIALRVPGAVGDDLRRVAAQTRTRLAADEMRSRRMLDGYSDLAMMGHAASVVGRTVSLGLEQLRADCAAVREALTGPGHVDARRLARTMGLLEERLADTSEQMALVLQTPGPARRRRGMDVPAELERIRERLGPLLAQEEAGLSVEAEVGGVLRIEMRPESFHAVVASMVTNALEWKSPDRPLKIIVAVQTVDDSVELLVSDNGSGVMQALEGTLFEPMVSGKQDGGGMGLTLVRNVITAHGGSVALLLDRRRKGATFRFLLPRKRSRATTAR